jgi:hypothetical protein
MCEQTDEQTKIELQQTDKHRVGNGFKVVKMTFNLCHSFTFQDIFLTGNSYSMSETFLGERSSTP